MKTILIIDDDDLCRGAASALLRRRDWQVFEADNGEDGITLAQKHRPDFILCDLLMPRGNGYAVCRAVRALWELRNTRLLVMSGRDYPTDRENAVEAGAEHYFIKPMEFEELERVLNKFTADGTSIIPRVPTIVEVEDDQAEDYSAHTLLRFWGVRGSIPTPGPETAFYGGNTSCVELRADGELIILDAGTGIRALGLALTEEFKERTLALTLLITHTHWDHIQGFPYFRPAYDSKNQVRILGYEGARAGLAATLAGQMESPYFPIPLKQMPGNLKIEELREMEFRIGQVRVTTCFSKHPGVCVGYRLHTSSGSIVFLPDNEWSEAETTAAQEEEPCTHENSLLDFVRNADVMIIDAQYDREEYEVHRGWGHGCVDDVVRLAVLANVKTLYLFHHDPEHDDARVTLLLEHARKLASLGGTGLQVEASREKEVVVLRKA